MLTLARFRTCPGRYRGLGARFMLLIVLIAAGCSGSDDDDPTATVAAAPEVTATTASAAVSTSTEATATSTTVAPADTATTTSPSPTTAPATSTATETAALEPCSAAGLVSQIQTPVPATPVPPTATVANPTPPPPTPTFAPAPQEDRVGFPEGYQESFKLMFVFDRPDNQQVRIICGNDEAVAAAPGEPFPYGSVLVMETYRTRKDANGVPVLDANGRYIREALTGVFIMRKEQGFGEAYQEQRSGEWEYVAFRPNGEYLSPPERSNPCAACHVQAGQDKDWVFRADMFNDPETAFTPPEIGENEINVWDYQFIPVTFTVKAGTTVTWVNNDEIEHTVTHADKQFDSGVFKAGETFSMTFDTPGTYTYVCTIHRGMTATLEVTN